MQPLTVQSWVYGPSAPSPKGYTPGAPILHENNQSSWFNITYQTQSNASTFGPVLATEVQLGGLSIPDFGVGVATQLAFGYPLDGFMGLAFKGLNTGMQCSSSREASLANDDAVQPKQQPTIMEAAQPYLQQPIFTVGLRPNAQGSLNFGYVDDSLYQGNLISAPINASQASWVVDAITLSASSATVTQSMLFGHLSPYSYSKELTVTAESDYERRYRRLRHDDGGCHIRQRILGSSQRCAAVRRIMDLPLRLLHPEHDH